MVTARRGASSLGCLFTLMVIVAIAYFGLPIGEAFYRFYRYEDAMKQAGRFARLNNDASIRASLAAMADSIGLPNEAKRIGIQRRGSTIVIGAQYTETFELPGTVREYTFKPRAEVPY